MNKETFKSELKEQFIELRAEGRSYADIATALNVSKPTLLNWSRELEREIANAKTLRLDALFETYLVGKAKRVETFGKKLQAILTELDKRDLAHLKTSLLLKLALDYGNRLSAEAEPLTLRDKLEVKQDNTWNGENLLEEPTWPA